MIKQLDLFEELSKYSKEYPKVEGWYWMKSRVDEPYIVYVFICPGHSYLCIESPDTCKHTKSDYLPVKLLNSEWAGPIHEPI